MFLWRCENKSDVERVSQSNYDKKMSISRFLIKSDFWSDENMSTQYQFVFKFCSKPAKPKEELCVRLVFKTFQISYCKDAQLNLVTMPWPGRPAPPCGGFCEIIVIIMKIFWEILSDWRGLTVAVTTPSMSTQWVEIIEPRTKVKIALILYFFKIKPLCIVQQYFQFDMFNVFEAL